MHRLNISAAALVALAIPGTGNAQQLPGPSAFVASPGASGQSYRGGPRHYRGYGGYGGATLIVDTDRRATNSLWRSDSGNDWWHDRPDRAYPRWMQDNRVTCARQWYDASGNLRC